MYVTSPGISEKRLWLKSIREAKKRYLHTEQQYLQKQKSSKYIIHTIGFLITSHNFIHICTVFCWGLYIINFLILEKGIKAVGRLLVNVMEGENLADRDKTGKSV